MGYISFCTRITAWYFGLWYELVAASSQKRKKAVCYGSNSFIKTKKNKKPKKKYISIPSIKWTTFNYISEMSYTHIQFIINFIN